MNPLLIVGDVHGCFSTLKVLLKNHWNEDSEILIQTGDLIDRGNYSPETLLFAYELSFRKNPNAHFIKGNHEFELLKHFFAGPNDNWLKQGGDVTLKQFEKNKINISDYLNWLKELPLKWENEYLLITHAGINSDTANPFDEQDKRSVLWNRGPVRNCGKLQIFGHTPTKSHKPEYDEISNSWNIDTGAYLGHGLSALKISDEGSVLEIIQVHVNEEDISLTAEN